MLELLYVYNSIAILPLFLIGIICVMLFATERVNAAIKAKASLHL